MYTEEPMFKYYNIKTCKIANKSNSPKLVVNHFRFMASGLRLALRTKQ